MMEGRISILIAEDHATVRGGVRALLESEPELEVVGEAANGEDAVTLAKQLQPDVVLMDIGMPELDGARATRRVKSSLPKTKVLVLTRHDEDGYMKRLLAEGADGFVLKQSAPNVLINAVKQVAAGNGFLDPSMTGSLMTGLTDSDGSARTGSGAELTPRETSVIRLVARGHSINEIAEYLDVSPKTIESAKAQAIKKLGLSDRVEIVRYAIRRGWMTDN
jgi:DNA-binding NarL/FixJ family response regulator